MHIALTGGTGFIGQRLVGQLRTAGHTLTLLSRDIHRAPPVLVTDPGISIVPGRVDERDAVERTLRTADAVGHLAGINAERGRQTYAAVHERGTRLVMETAEEFGIDSVVLTSYLRARPGTTSAYLTSKWRAESQCRRSPVPTTVLKLAGVFGPGDQFLTNLGRWLQTIPILPRPAGAPRIRPVAVTDVVAIVVDALTQPELADSTVAVMGPETLSLDTFAHRVGDAIGRAVHTTPVPQHLVRASGWIQERMLTDPIITQASARMLAEGMESAAPTAGLIPLPTHLRPTQPASLAYINDHLGDPTRLGLNDIAIG